MAVRRLAISAVGARLRALPTSQATGADPADPVPARAYLWPAILVAAALALTVAGSLTAGATQQTLLILGSAAAAMIPVAAAVARGRLDPFELGVAVSLAYLVLFPVRASVVLLGWDPGTNRGAFTASDPVIRDALVAITLGLVAGGIGYVAPLGQRLGARVRIPSSRAVERPSAVVAALLFLVGAAAQGLILAASRNPALPLIGGRGSGLVSSSSVFMLVGLCMLTRRAFLSRERADLVWLGAAMLVGAAIGVVGQFKEVVIVSLLAPLVMAHFTGSRGIRARWIVLAALIAVFAVFPIVTSWRQASGLAGSENPVTVLSKLPSNYLHHDLLTGGERTLQPADIVTEPLAVVSRRLYGFDSLTLAVRYTPSQILYRRGATLEGLWAGVVPRLLWPSKPNIGIGYWFAVHYWGTPPEIKQVPQTVTHPGELYIDFGVAGVILGMALLGLWYRFAYSALRPRESATAAMFYTILLLTAVSVDRDLPLVYVTLLQRLVVVTLLLVALTWISRRRAARP